MADEHEEKAVSDYATLSDKDWFTLALVTFLLSAIIIAGAAIWVFAPDEQKSLWRAFSGGSSMVQRAQAFAPFGVALGAVVTFCTIAWRGVLNTRQLEYQAEQIKHQAQQLALAQKQNDAKDEENLAKLLMEGTKLLGAEQASHILAGIAALQSVVVSAKLPFAPVGMDILADQAQAAGKEDSTRNILEAAANALNEGARAGQKSRRKISFNFFNNAEDRALAINGMVEVKYYNAEVSGAEFSQFDDLKSYIFRKCVFNNCTIKKGVQARDCTFKNSRIRHLTDRMMLDNTFEKCDFTGVTFRRIMVARARKAELEERLEALRDKGNFMEVDYTDTSWLDPSPITWGNYLELRDVTESEEDEFDITTQ
ncbi:hypothetical protein [Rhizobium sp. SYY.PMSO]|uniref:hypothetical protein n=1 Tax=Rhizobium sp. SYY.PMSO TaxID=3382192 RepID=UPI00398FBBE0